MKIAILTITFAFIFVATVHSQSTIKLKLKDSHYLRVKSIKNLTVFHDDDSTSLNFVAEEAYWELPLKENEAVMRLLICTKRRKYIVVIPEKGFECGKSLLTISKGNLRKIYSYTWELCGSLGFGGTDFIEK